MALLDAMALAHYRRARRWHMRAYHAFSAVFTRSTNPTAERCPGCATASFSQPRR